MFIYSKERNSCIEVKSVELKFFLSEELENPFSLVDIKKKWLEENRHLLSFNTVVSAYSEMELERKFEEYLLDRKRVGKLYINSEFYARFDVKEEAQFVFDILIESLRNNVSVVDFDLITFRKEGV